MIEYFFPMIPPKFIVPYFLILLQILSYDFYFPAKFYMELLYLNIFVQVNFVILFLHVYILHMVLYLNKLYNFYLA